MTVGPGALPQQACDISALGELRNAIVEFARDCAVRLAELDKVWGRLEHEAAVREAAAHADRQRRRADRLRRQAAGSDPFGWGM